MEYILSQIFIVLGYIFIGLTYFAKNRKIILVYSITAIIANAISYIFLSAWSGLLMSGVALLRNIIFLFQNKKDKTEKITWVDWLILAILVVIAVISAVFTYEGFLSLFSIFATMLYTISVWQKNVKAYKIIGIFVSILWIVYFIFISSIFGAICEGILFITEIVGAVKYIKYQNKELTQNNESNKNESVITE